jgi:hypothetical protein
VDCCRWYWLARWLTQLLLRIVPPPPHPLPSPRYVYDVRASNDGVTLPGRTPAAILRMGAALHVTHRLRLFLFRLRCLASSSQLDPQDPLSMVLGHPAVKGDASLAAAAERILGVHQSRKHALWLPSLGAVWTAVNL